MSLLYWLFGGSGIIVGALVMNAVSGVQLQWKIDAAVKADRGVQVQLCDKRVGELANKLNAESDAALDAALDARSSIGRTPIDQAELQDVCDAESECRDPSADAKKVQP